MKYELYFEIMAHAGVVKDCALCPRHIFKYQIRIHVRENGFHHPISMKKVMKNKSLRVK